MNNSERMRLNVEAGRHPFDNGGSTEVEKKAKELLDALDYWKSDAAKWPCCFPVERIEALRKAFEDKGKK